MTTANASPREALGAIRAQLASLPSGTALERELRRAEITQIARMHRVELPLGAAERRLKAGFERMLNGLEGLDELNELNLRILVKEQLDAEAPKKALNALGWLVAERGISDLCLSLYAGGAELAVMLEGAVLGRRLSTLEELLTMRPNPSALRLAMEACLVMDALDAARLLHRAGAPVDDAAAAAVSMGKLDWVQRLLTWGAPADAVLVQAAFDGSVYAITLAMARGALSAQQREGLPLAEIARTCGHLEAAALLTPPAVARAG
jgi:hypothetical protein